MEKRTQVAVRQAAIFFGTGMLFAAVGAAAVITSNLWLLLFGSVVLAVFIRSLSDFVAEKTRMHQTLALALVLLVILAAAVLSGIWLEPKIADQFEILLERLPTAFERIQSYVERTPGGKRLLQTVGEAGGEGKAFSGFIDALSISLGGSMNLLVIVITGLYISFEPGMYKRGFLRLFPVSSRPRAETVLVAIGSTLRKFLLGRVVSMIAVGIATWIGLTVIDVPAAGLLGLVAGTLTFVPYAGPIAASIPIALAALLEGPAVLAYAMIYYTAVQMLEGFLITPLVQERVVMLPPALTLAAEVFMGLLFGIPGVVLSVPAAAIAITFVRMVYVGDLLGDHEAEAGE